MKNFKDFGIKPSQPGLSGDKIKMDRVLNREIVVNDFRIFDSKHPQKGNGKCLQIGIKIGESNHVIFTGSIGLQDQINQIPKSEFPFLTTIVKEDERLIFT